MGQIFTKSLVQQNHPIAEPWATKHKDSHVTMGNSCVPVVFTDAVRHKVTVSAVSPSFGRRNPGINWKVGAETKFPVKHWISQSPTCVFCFSVWPKDTSKSYTWYYRIIDLLGIGVNIRGLLRHCPILTNKFIHWFYFFSFSLDWICGMLFFLIIDGVMYGGSSKTCNNDDF